MRHHRGLAVSIGIACVVMTAGLVPARGGEAPTPPGRVRRADDAVWAAARREAEANKRQAEANFARLRGLPAAEPLLRPAAGRIEVQADNLVVVQGDVLVLGGVLVRPGLQARDRGGPDADPPFEEEPAPPRFIVAEGLVDRVLFGSRNQEWFSSHLDALLAARVEDAGRKWRLTPDERDKLRLAGRGDVKRFFDRVDAKRGEFLLVREDLARCQQLVREIVPLRSTLTSGPFGEGSIYSKVLRRILQEGQDADRQAR